MIVHSIKVTLMFLTLMGITGLSTFVTSGQSTENRTNNPVPKPSDEEFEDSIDVVIPWRDSFKGCDGVWSAVKWPDCPRIGGKEMDERSMLKLYNGDGTIWYSFSVLHGSDGAPPDFVERNADFRPLAPTPRADNLGSVVLRLVAESPHWYRVEVNEQTRATKFILKSDPNWVKTSWGFLFNWSRRIYIDQDRVKLRDKPDGEIINEYAAFHYDALIFRKIEGDWLYVEGVRNFFTPNLYYGWIRWRKGRDILVGSLLNHNKIPESTRNEKEQ